MNDSSRERWRTVARVGMVVGVLALGAGVFQGLKASRKQPAALPRVDPGALVQTAALIPDARPVWIQANGTVIPARQALLSAEVAGRIVWQSPGLIPGGQVSEGSLLVRLDPTDYRLLVEQQRAQLGRAELELELERGRKKIAEREWELLDAPSETAPDAAPEGRALALREPQLKTARVARESAESALRSAERNVSKTQVRAPFNGFIKTESVELGQLVGPAAPLLTLVGTDSFWVQVAVPLESLAWLKVPGVNATAGQGSVTQVLQRAGETETRREGRIVQLMGELDPVGRMARLLVEIENPLTVREGELPILLGAWVEVRLMGPTLDDVVEIPRTALHDDTKIYVMTPEGTLTVRVVNVVWRERESVLARAALASGESLITSKVAAPVEGMKLRVAATLPSAGASAKPAKPATSAKTATPPAPATPAAPTTPATPPKPAKSAKSTTAVAPAAPAKAGAP